MAASNEFIFVFVALAKAIAEARSVASAVEIFAMASTCNTSPVNVVVAAMSAFSKYLISLVALPDTMNLSVLGKSVMGLLSK